MPFPFSPKNAERKVFLCGATKTGKTGFLVATGVSGVGEDVRKDYPGLKPINYDKQFAHDATFLTSTPPKCWVVIHPEDVGGGEGDSPRRPRGFPKLVNDGRKQIHADAKAGKGEGLQSTLDDVTKMSFGLGVQTHTLQQRTVFGDKAQVDFTVYDGPGEDIVPPTDDRPTTVDPETRKNLIQLAKQADAMFLCLNEFWNDDTRERITYTLSLLKGAVKFKMVVLLDTHCDRVLYDKQHRAREVAIENDSVDHVLGLLDKPGCAVLDDVLARDAEIYCGYTSLYGFLESSGEPNYVEGDNTLLDREDMSAWKPFGVIDPWRLVATGHPGRLKRVTRERLLETGKLESQPPKYVESP